MTDRSFSITTRTGDGGDTRLFSGETVSKSSPRPTAYGALDELVAYLGIARSLAAPDTAAEILTIQRDLFRVGSELATSPAGLDRLPQRVDADFLTALDARRDALEAAIEMPKGFVVPGEDPVSAHLDYARTLARRVERHAVVLAESGELQNPVVVTWLNRLSDHLWLLARSVETSRTMAKDSQ